MADTLLSITRSVPRKSMLFHLLREKGIGDIQEKAARSWTDHNTHDPGVTILEALGYIVTELGNQLNFSFADLIATPKGIAAANINYPSAATNLPAEAVTILDLRKIILDMAAIRNAYFEITTESKIPVFLDPALQVLTYTSGPTVVPVQWGGLYALQLEFEDEDLNANLLNETIQVPVGMIIKNVDIIISFKYWDEINEEFFRNNTISAITLEDNIVILNEEEYEDYYSEWKIDFSDGSSVADFPVWVRLVEPLAPTDPMIPNLLVALETALGNTGPTGPFARYKTRLMSVQAILAEVRATYHLHRNVGEDLSLMTALRLQEVAIDTYVEILPTADPVEINAQILFVIESFFAPRPLFRSLDDLLKSADFKVDGVFLGPLLNSGFLSEESLTMLSRGNVIYVSDLVRMILEISDTLAVRDLSLSTYFNNFEAIKNERNCLRIKGGDRFKPRLSIPRSNVVLTRNGVAVTVDQTQVLARLNALRSSLTMGTSSALKDLDIPFGTFPIGDSYRSVQYELPVAYGTGAAGLPQFSPPERIAQLKQLQGYLFFFDQILANTYTQLANVGDLFSVHQEKARSYYYQTLYHLPGAEDLLGHLGEPGPWEDFVASDDNEYIRVLDAAGEPGDTFFQRRNAMLDYLLARTAENRQDYSAILASMPGSSSPDIILEEKEKFLEKYPRLSKERAMAYNYLLHNAGVPDVWDSPNVGGYERMVCNKLGFPSCRKRTLYHPLADNFEFFNVVIPPVSRKFRMKDNSGNNLIVSNNHFPNDIAATESIKVLLEFGRYREHYEIFKLVGGTFSFRIVHGNLDMAYEGAAVLPTILDAENTIRTVIDIVGGRYSLEGIHVVEHILLRPRIKGLTDVDSDRLFKLLTAGDTLLTDPYSHVVSVMLPSGMEKDFALNTLPEPGIAGYRIRDPEYALYAQQTILREAPAHLLVNIFFLDVDTDPNEAMVDDRPSLQNFERKFKAWREVTANPTATPVAKRLAQRQLVRVIEKIYGL